MLLEAIGVALVAVLAILLMPGSTPRLDRRRYPKRPGGLESILINGTQQWVATSVAGRPQPDRPVCAR